MRSLVGSRTRRATKTWKTMRMKMKMRRMRTRAGLRARIARMKGTTLRVHSR